MLIHTITALSLHDAFISCWDEKYRGNRIRPETVINRYIDEKWQPLIQTPPFPEYPSGHSVISSAAAVVLTHFFGDHFSFTDSTEKYIGLDPRHFSSLNAAANEACISRLYGGIHFRDAIENGALQGKEIGNFIIGELKGL
jgi:membrane-associated phospholipid phosphatase